MTRRILWSLLPTVLITAPLLASPQDPNPCTPIAAGVGCSARVSGPWASVNLGKPVVEPKPGDSPWRWAAPADSHSPWAAVPHTPFTHHGGFNRVGDLTIYEMAPRAIDCAMAWHASPATDTRMVHAPRGGVTFLSVIVPVAPCKGK